MIEIISHPITLLCLGVIFVLCALLFFYFKRSMMVIEQAQMEQATVLRNFIASLEMKKHESPQFSSGVMNGYREQETKALDGSSLIEVSDNEVKSEEEYEGSSDENAYETESETNSEYSSTTIDDEDNGIKVVKVEDLEELAQKYDIEEISMERSPGGGEDGEESVSTSCDDMFSTDLDKMELENTGIVGEKSDVDMRNLSKTAFIQATESTGDESVLAATNNDNIKQFDQMSILLSHEDFKGYTVSQIREYAVHRNIITKGDKKLKKKELVDYVIEANIEGGAEHLKVNKVGSTEEDVVPDDNLEQHDVSSLMEENVGNMMLPTDTDIIDSGILEISDVHELESQNEDEQQIEIEQEQ